MYTVIFKRKDNQPDEIYTYISLEEVRYHFNLFKDADSDIYNRIELCKKWFIANDNGCIEILIAIFKAMVIRMNENVLNYKKESAKLFERWKNTELHKENVFIKDGIVCPETWFNSDKRPLYLLKEAYGGNDDWNLIDDYLTKNDNINSVTWRRVSLWSKGILKTSKDHLEVFNPEDEELHKFNNKYLRNIAVINVKKVVVKNLQVMMKLQNMRKKTKNVC